MLFCRDCVNYTLDILSGIPKLDGGLYIEYLQPQLLKNVRIHMIKASLQAFRSDKNIPQVIRFMTQNSAFWVHFLSTNFSQTIWFMIASKAVIIVLRCT